jgi:hypothetical protein
MIWSLRPKTSLGLKGCLLAEEVQLIQLASNRTPAFAIVFDLRCQLKDASNHPPLESSEDIHYRVEPAYSRS